MLIQILSDGGVWAGVHADVAPDIGDEIWFEGEDYGWIVKSRYFYMKGPSTPGQYEMICKLDCTHAE